MDERVASRYARAVFAAAKAQNVIGPVGDDLDAIAGMLSGNSRLAGFLGDPDRSRADKEKMFDQLFSDRAIALTMQLLRLLVEKQRETIIPEIQSAYGELRREHEMVLEIKVESARDLAEDLRNALEKKIGIATGRKVQAHYSVDPALIGGIKVELAGYVMDGTVRSGLGRIRETLQHDIYKQN